MGRCAFHKFARRIATTGIATAEAATSTGLRRHQLFAGLTELRKLIVIAAITIALTNLIPDADAVDVRRYRSEQTQIDRLADLLRAVSKRNVGQTHKCYESRRKCFSSVQCCRGLVCVVSDDYLANDPEIPGTCVREKDLTLCSSSSDCPTPGSWCTSLRRTGQRYCVAPPGSGASRDTTPPTAMQLVRTKSGGLGSLCRTSADCNELSYDGGSLLCCQVVHMHRQGSRQICDRHRPAVSVCL